MNDPTEPSKAVLIRDLLIFQLKLALDGLKDLVLSPLSLVAAALDILMGPGKRGSRLYRLLRLGERFDLYLNLFGAVQKAERRAEGLFAGSEPGDGTMLGALEGLSVRDPESTAAHMSARVRARLEERARPETAQLRLARLRRELGIEAAGDEPKSER